LHLNNINVKDFSNSADIISIGFSSERAPFQTGNFKIIIDKIFEKGICAAVNNGILGS